MMKIPQTRFLSSFLVIVFMQLNNLHGEIHFLNGIWEIGEDRNYIREMIVPGLLSDPSQMNERNLWLKREIQLPSGDWTHATLILKGALFSPSVYINGEKVSQQNGGMAPTYHSLNHAAIKE